MLLGAIQCQCGSCIDTLKAEKEQMIQALNSHRINTVGELRRIEKAFAELGSPDVAAPITAACKWTCINGEHA